MIWGYQHWRDLLFVHWPLPAAELRPLVPAPLSIDEFEGAAYVSLVCFVVYDARPLGVPRALGLSFLETNVRTYVHLDGQARGVYFFSLDAGSLLAVLGARAAFGLPYFWARGLTSRDQHTTTYTLARRGRRDAWCRARYALGASLGPAAAGSLDHFLIERYLLHVRRGPTVWTVRVRHQPYRLRQVELLDLDEQLVAAAGLMRSAGRLVHYADGVDVAVDWPLVQAC